LWLNDTSYVAKVSEEVNRYSTFLGTHWYKFQPPYADPERYKLQCTASQADSSD